MGNLGVVTFPATAKPSDAWAIHPFGVTKAGMPIFKDSKAIKTAPKIEFETAAKATLAPGGYFPNAPNNKTWSNPFGTLTSKHGYPLLYTYSLIIALVCGTAGLPHILVRFYTNPDGRSAKRTAMLVMIMLGCFYVFTPMWQGIAVRKPTVPVLVVIGANDTDIPAAISLRLARWANADVYQYAKTSHIGPLMGRRTPEIADAAQRWITSRRKKRVEN